MIMRDKTRKKNRPKLKGSLRSKNGGNLFADIGSKFKQMSLLTNSKTTKNEFEKIAIKEIKDDNTDRMEYLKFLLDKVDLGLKACSLKTKDGQKKIKTRKYVETTLETFINEIEEQIENYRKNLRELNLALTMTTNALDWLLEYRNSDTRVLRRLEKTLDYYKKTQSDITAGVIEDKDLCSKKVVEFHLKRLRKDIVFASKTRRTHYQQEFKKHFKQIV